MAEACSVIRLVRLERKTTHLPLFHYSCADPYPKRQATFRGCALTLGDGGLGIGGMIGRSITQLLEQGCLFFR